MSIHTLQNSYLSIRVDTTGAELTSIKDLATEKEYLWQADPAYWKRHAPILFPIVGSLKEKSYTYQGKSYSLPQHGFARDMEFIPVSQSENELWFSLEANDDTRKLYPFHFRLELGYRLTERKITALWKVTNQGKETMYFSIGGHPAFLCPLDASEQQSDCFLSFDTEAPIHYLLVNENGLLVKKPAAEQEALITNHGILRIDPHMFDRDALVIEDHQCHKVSLLDASKKPYLSVSFDAPLFGLWSPVGKNAPFLCIEPWYGRCDATDFIGSLCDRDYSNCLPAGKSFEKNYHIEIH